MARVARAGLWLFVAAASITLTVFGILGMIAKS